MKLIDRLLRRLRGPEPSNEPIFRVVDELDDDERMRSAMLAFIERRPVITKVREAGDGE